MTLKIIFFLILVSSGLIGNAQIVNNRVKVENGLNTLSHLPAICKDLPKFKYNQDSTEIIYIEKIDLATKAESLLDSIKVPDLGKDIIIEITQIRKDRLRFKYWYYPKGYIGLDARIELNIVDKSLFIKVYKTKVLNEETNKYIPMAKLKAMVNKSEIKRPSFYCENLIIYDQKLNQVIGNFKQQVLIYSTKASN